MFKKKKVNTVQSSMLVFIRTLFFLWLL